MKFRNKKTGEIVEWDSTLINSSLVSAQNRKRLYWANWTFPQPEDRHIYLKDIIEDGDVDREKSYTIDANYYKGGNPRSYFEDGKRQLVFEHQSQKGAMVKISIKSLKHGWMPEKIVDSNKYPSLAAQDPDTKYKVSTDDGYNYRKLYVVECERLQTLQDGYTDAGISNTQRYKGIGNGWTVDVVTHILSFLPEITPCNEDK